MPKNIEGVSVNENLEENDLGNLLNKAIKGVIEAGFGAVGTAIGLAETQIGSGRVFENYENPTRFYIGLGLLVTSFIVTYRGLKNFNKFCRYINKNKKNDEPTLV